jgi:mannose-1-phosphate guanylyltransferase
MRPLSDAVPKPALPLPGGPLIGWALRLVLRVGLDRVAVNTWHLPSVLKTACLHSKPRGLEILFSQEDNRLGTAGGLAWARDAGLLGDDGPVLVLNGDCALNLDLEPLYEKHAQGSDLVTFALLPHLDPQRWSRVVLDAKGCVTDIRPPGDPKTNEVPLLHTGVMIVSREGLEMLPAGNGSIRELLFPQARELNRLGGAVVTGHWREVGTPETYLDTVLALLGDRTLVEDASEVEPEAWANRSLVAAGGRIEAGARVSESVVAHGAVVESGAEVIRSVVLGECRISTGDVVEGSFRVA